MTIHTLDASHQMVKPGLSMMQQETFTGIIFLIVVTGRTENKTRIIKMTSLNGEYLLLGRKVDDTSNIFLQFGQGVTRTFNTTGGSRVDGEWIDGFRMSIQTPKDAQINVDVKQPFTPALAAGFTSIGIHPAYRLTDTVPWSYIINSTTAGSQFSANMSFPSECT